MRDPGQASGEPYLITGRVGSLSNLFIERIVARAVGRRQDEIGHGDQEVCSVVYSKQPSLKDIRGSGSSIQSYLRTKPILVFIVLPELVRTMRGRPIFSSIRVNVVANPSLSTCRKIIDQVL